MFYHKKCKELVHVIASNILVLLNVGVSYTKLTANSINILRIENSKKELEYWCPYCSEIVKEKDLVSFCCECRKLFDIDDVYINRSSGGVYCIRCIENLFPGEPKRKLSYYKTVEI
jgi:hypothetical protein